MKKIMTIALAAAMCMSMTVSALASPVHEEIVPLSGTECPVCFGEMYRVNNTGPWEIIGYRSCINGKTNHMDTVQERTVTKGFKCGHCGLTDTITSTETKVVCPD